MLCEICNKDEEKDFSSGNKFFRHFKSIHNITYQNYYDKYLKKENDGICIICKKSTAFCQRNYRITCESKECIFKLKQLNTYNSWKNPKIREARKSIWRNSDFLERHRIASRKVCNKLWKDIEFRKKIKRRTIEAAIENRYDPKCIKERKDRGKRHSISMKELYKNKPELRKKRSELTKESWKDPERRKKGLDILTEISKKNDRYKCGHFFSIKNNKNLHYRSSYELKAYKKLESDVNVKSYIVEPFYIEYVKPSDNTEHSFHPDIFIEYANNETTLLEIKPEYQLSDPIVLSKFHAAKQYCQEHNITRFECWTEKELDLVHE